MVKASAIYLVIIIALVIAIICSSLIAAAYFYRAQYQAKFRSDRLQNNLSSCVHLLLTSRDDAYLQSKTMSLFNNGDDSATLKKTTWGIYDVNVATVFKQRDTLFKVFTTAHGIDSSKWAAIYLIDEDRPLSVSGKTTINGTAYIPKAGVKPAYVDNKAYQGDKRLIIGQKHDSQRLLPPLNDSRLNLLKAFFNSSDSSRSAITDTVKRSFRQSTYQVHFGKNAITLKNISLSGNIILYSDTLLTIDSTASFSNILIFAKAILVKSGFRGNCQLFATDSIGIEKNCSLDYPSCLGLLRYQTPLIGFPAQINIGQNSRISGTVFSYEKEKSGLPAMISLGKNAVIKGQVYAQHIFQTSDNAEIDGSVFTGRFMYQSQFTRYENYLINLTINSGDLSSYYLTSELLPVAAKQKKVLQWLEIK
jgi:hypothetical protein